jgi:hypothetical protein
MLHRLGTRELPENDKGRVLFGTWPFLFHVVRQRPYIPYHVARAPPPTSLHATEIDGKTASQLQKGPPHGSNCPRTS